MLAPYGLTGRSGVSSSIGSWSGVTCPYCSALPTTSTRSTPAASAASSTWRVPTAFTRRTSAGADHELPTWLAAARWYTASGRRLADGLADGLGVGDVHLVAEPDHLVALGLEVGTEVAADEAAGAGEERPHGRTLGTAASAPPASPAPTGQGRTTGTSPMAGRAEAGIVPPKVGASPKGCTAPAESRIQ